MKKMQPLIKSAVIAIIFALFANISAKSDSPEYWGEIAGPWGGDVTCMVEGQNGAIYAGTWGDGVYYSGDGGENWDKVNNGLGNLHITQLAVNSVGTLLATTWNGVYKSTNAGVVWTDASSNLPFRKVRSICIHPEGHIFIGTKGYGVFMSSSMGSSWEEVNTGLYYRDVKTLTVAPNDSSVIAGAYGGGIYRTTDMGSTWERKTTGVTNNYFNDFLVSSSGDIYAATNGRGVLISIDNGLSWTEIARNDSVITDLNITAIEFNEDGELIAGTRMKGVWRFDNRFMQIWDWTFLKDYGVNDIIKLEDGTMLCAQPLNGVFKSSDGGDRWVNIAFDFNQSNGIKQMLSHKSGKIAAEGLATGVYYSEDNGDNWSMIGMEGQEIYSFAFDSTGTLYCGVENGVYKYSGSNSWTDLNYPGAIPTSMGIDMNGNFFVGDTNIYKGDLDGVSWEMIGEIGNGGEISAIAIAPNQDIYAGTMFNGMLLSKDGGGQWGQQLQNQLNPDLMINSEITSIVFGNDDQYIFTSGYKGVCLTRNGGDTWGVNRLGRTWEPFVKTVAKFPRGDIFAGLSWGEGVFYTPDYGVNWDTLKVGMTQSKMEAGTFNDNGYVFMATTKIWRAIDSTKLTPPALVNLEADTVGTSLTPLFTWELADFAEMCQLEYSTYDDFAIATRVTLSQDAFRVEKPLQYNTKYYWRVRSKANAAVSQWSEVREFTTMLEPPMLHMPANDSAGVRTDATAHWFAVDGAAEYNIEIALDDQFANVVFSSEGVADTTAQFNGLDHYTFHYWRVKAFNDETASDWSQIWKFQTVVAPPVHISPADSAMDTQNDVEITWEESEGANEYDIQISRDENFTVIIYDGATDDETLHTLENLDYNTTYWWRLRAKNDDGKSDWSTPWSFTTAIEGITLVLPDSAKTATKLNQNFRWNEGDDAEFYQVQIAEDIDFNSIVVDEETNQTSQTFSVPDYFTEYFWRVRIKIGDRYSVWSPVWTFRTLFGTPTLLSPANDAEDQKLSLYLKWNDLKGAIYYKLQVSTEGSFLDLNKFVYEADDIELTQRDIQGLEYETKYYWRVKALHEDEESPWSEIWNFATEEEPGSVFDRELAGEIDLTVYPNPFSSGLKAEFALDAPARAKIEIADALGNVAAVLCDQTLPAGANSFEWNSAQASQGVYFIKILVGDKFFVKRVALVK